MKWSQSASRPVIKPGIPGVADDQPVPGMVVVGPPHLAVLGEVIHAGNFVTCSAVRDEVAADEASRPADQERAASTGRPGPGASAYRYQPQVGGQPGAQPELRPRRCGPAKVVGISATGRRRRRALAGELEATSKPCRDSTPASRRNGTEYAL